VGVRAPAAVGGDMGDSQKREEWIALVDAHGDALWALVRKLCRHRQDAEDAFQEAAARAWRLWPGRAAIANPRAWLMTVGYRAFLDVRRKATVVQSHGVAVEHEPVDRRHPAPATAAVATEEACRVRAAVAALPDEVREVFVLHYAGNLSIAEAAAAMGIKTGTAKSRLAAGLNELRQRLA
jgi:RNA polymerase sigma factor (sigma-70 family)